MIRVAVVDDQELLRAGLVMLLESADDIEVVGQAGDGRAAIAIAGTARPDVMLMDIRMPGLDGIDATRSITAAPGGARVIMLTTFDEDELVYRALHAGASGFLLKETRPAELLDAIRVVAGGEALLSPKVTKRLIARFTAETTPPSPSRPVPALTGLTERERDVLAAVAGGLANQEIAARLHIGYGTVKTHVSHLLTKLGCRERAQLVMIAYETGLVRRRP